MDSSDKKFLARLALILFVCGLTIPFIITIFADESIAMGFGVVAEVLALILGVLSWKHIFGKVVTVGVVILMALAGGQYIGYLNLKANVEDEMRQTMEVEKTKAEQAGAANSLPAEESQ